MMVADPFYGIVLRTVSDFRWEDLSGYLAEAG
jgi:hypothetical protein